MENLTENTLNDIESVLDDYVVKKLDQSKYFKELGESFEEEFNNSNEQLKKINASISNSADEIKEKIEDKFEEQNDSLLERFRKVDEKSASNLKILQDSLDDKFNNSSEQLEKFNSNVSNLSDKIQNRIEDKFSNANDLLQKINLGVLKPNNEIQNLINNKFEEQNDSFFLSFQKIDAKSELINEISDDIKNVQKEFREMLEKLRKTNFINRILIIGFGLVNIAVLAIVILLFFR